MPENVGFIRVEADDPNRCQAVHGNQQCPYRAKGTRQKDGTWQGLKYCIRHAGYGTRAEQIENTRLYFAAKWKEKIGFQADHPKIRTLSEEIGIMRMMLNAKLEQCDSEVDLMMHMSSIVEVTREIGKLLQVVDKLDQKSAALLDKNKALAWVQELLVIISDYISDPEILQQLSDRMINSLEQRTK